MDGNEVMLIITINLVTFITIGFIIFYILYTRNKERMSILKLDLPAEELGKLLNVRSGRSRDKNSLLKYAFMAIGFGLALLAIPFVPEDMLPAIPFGLIFIFPGIGLIIFYRFFQTKADTTESVQ